MTYKYKSHRNHYLFLWLLYIQSMFMANIIVFAHNTVDKHQESVCFSNKTTIKLL